jgi:hypothetical protein
MKTMIDTILLVNNLKPEDWARKPRGTFAGCTNYEFIEKLIKHETGREFSKQENWGEQTFNRTAQAVLAPIFGKLNGGGETWARVLLHSARYKKCPICEMCKNYSEYSADNNNYGSIDKYCKECKSVKNKQFYDANKDSYHKPYIEEHRGEYNARTAKRRASIASSTPKWADLEAIKLIYKNCPAGYHVDHIIPLQGDIVSGLHIETNLQYLKASDNIAKSNKYTI